MKKICIILLGLWAITAGFYANAEEKDENLKAILKECNAGASEQCKFLGEVYYTGLEGAVDKPKAIAYFTQACNFGNIEVCNDLGDIYKKGDGVIKKDKAKAKLFYGKSCDLKDTLGCAQVLSIH